MEVRANTNPMSNKPYRIGVAGEEVGRDIVGRWDVPDSLFEHEVVFDTFDGEDECTHEGIGGATTR